MAHYKNDYSKEEDIVLWQLHEIRHQLAEQRQSPEQINTIGLQVVIIQPPLSTNEVKGEK